MSFRRNLALVCGAVALSGVGLAVAHGVAQAAQAPVVVERFLLGYFDRTGQFVPVSGRRGTNVPRNAVVKTG